MRGLEIAGLESRSGLIMGDFHRWAGRKGRRVWQGALNVGFSAFHEGRGAEKQTPPGGHDLVNRKEIVSEKAKVHEIDVLLSTKIKACSTGSCHGHDKNLTRLLNRVKKNYPEDKVVVEYVSRGKRELIL